MKPAHVWACGALLFGGAAARGTEDYIPADGLRQTGLVKFWQLGLPLEAQQRLRDVYRVDDQLYLATQDGYVFAVHADTGALRWLRRITSSGYRVWRPCHARQRAIFVTPSVVLQLERLTGRGVAESPLAFAAGSPAVSDGTNYYLGAINGRFYAFNVYDQMEEWKVATAGPISSRPELHQGLLLVASSDGRVYACTAADKQYRWVAATEGPIVADLVADDNGVYVASQDQSLYLLDLRYGRPRWRARFSGALYEAPVLTAELAFQYCRPDGLVAVETAWLGVRRRFRWTLPRGRLLLTVDQQHAYVLSRDQSILVADLADGTIRHEIPAAGFTMGIPAPQAATLWLAGPDGRVFCARPRGVPFVRRQALRQALLPAGQGATPQTRPAASATPGRPKPASYLRSGRSGPPLNGKSKVSRQFGSAGGGGGQQR